jgi:hypothetical protein
LIPASLISFSLPLLGAATLGLVFVLIDKKVNWAEGQLVSGALRVFHRFQLRPDRRLVYFQIF